MECYIYTSLSLALYTHRDGKIYLDTNIIFKPENLTGMNKYANKTNAIISAEKITLIS